MMQHVQWGRRVQRAAECYVGCAALAPSLGARRCFGIPHGRTAKALRTSAAESPGVFCLPVALMRKQQRACYR